MRENLEIKGYWHLPDQEENRVAGILYYAPNEPIRLELIGSFEEPVDYLKSIWTDSRDVTKLIYGEDQNGVAITLINGVKYGNMNLNASFAIAKYSIEYLLTGIHVKSMDAPAFNKMTISVPLLTSWVNRCGINLSTTYREKRMVGYQLKYFIDDQLTIATDLADGLTLSIEHSSTMPAPQSEDLSISQHYTAILKSETNRSGSAFLKLASRFKSFIGLATLAGLDFTSIKLYSPDYYQDIESGRRVFRPIGLYFEQLPTEIREESKRTKQSFLFTYEKIEQEFPAVIQKWFGFDQSMMPILNHLADSLKSKTLFRSVNFLTVCLSSAGVKNWFIQARVCR